LQENICSWSENVRINDFIKERQQKAASSWEFFEWIPYDQFKNIKKIGRVGSVTIYSAEWVDGNLYIYNEENGKLHRDKNREVTLNYLDNSNDVNENILREVQYDIYS
jgi:hypothetical protein